MTLLVGSLGRMTGYTTFIWSDFWSMANDAASWGTVMGWLVVAMRYTRKKVKFKLIIVED